MRVIDDLLATLRKGQIVQVQVGAFWTAVVAQVEGERRCGLASTMRQDDHHHTGRPAVQDAGRLAMLPAAELAEMAHSPSLTEAAIGIAAINALIPRPPGPWIDLNAEDFIARHGAGKHVVLIGHFPFVSRLRERVGTLSVLEQTPRDHDLPSNVAPEVIPQAEVLAITGTTLINSTFDGLIKLAHPDALVLLLGPSTPLSPVLYDHRVHVLSGAVVEETDAVLRAISQGANFQQLHRQGVRVVTMLKSQG